MAAKLVARGTKTGVTLSGKPCVIARILANLSPADRKDLQDQLNDPEEHSSEIAFRLRQSNLKGTGTSVGTHRRGICSCPQNIKKESK